jgi:di/tricarboxylate transporter
MQNLIVLGQIPGTHIQITFGTWKMIMVIVLSLTTILFFVSYLYRAWRHQTAEYFEPIDQALQAHTSDES